MIMQRTLYFLCFVTLFLANTTKANLYGEASIGEHTTSVQKTLNYNATQASLSNKYSGVRWQLNLGYDVPTSDVLSFAIEAQAALNNGSTKSSVNPWFLSVSAGTRERVKFEADLFVLAKYHSNKNLTLFAGPGIARGRLSSNTTGQTAGYLGASGNHATYLPGLTGKIGIETGTAKEHFVLAYQYTVYKNKTFSGAEPLTGTIVSAKYRIFTNAITIGYKFG